MDDIQSREHMSGMETYVDTAQEAAMLARKVLMALARNIDEPALSSDNVVRERRTSSAVPINSVEPTACVEMRNPPFNAALQHSFERDLLDGTQNENSGSEIKLEDMMRGSNIPLAPIADNSNVLNFVKAIDDVNTTFCGSCKQNDIYGVSNNTGNLRSIEGENAAGTENNYKDHIEALENLLDGTGNSSLQTQNVEFDRSRNIQLGSEDQCGQETLQSTLSVNLRSYEDLSLERKNARDRRRAIARRRTLLRRKAEENARMLKIMENLQHLPEEERQTELKKMEHQQREDERRRKTEEKRRLGRQAVERCRGKAGLSQKALQMRLRTMRNENQKLRRVLVYLSRSGVVSAEQLLKYRIVIANEQTKRDSSKSIM